ncbi:MAG: lysylphosphatidylglycerol synthase transmembrane domain-containing protein [Bacteroidales bacterium]|nr:lysylphosphatidylglycerol synthase transmembrane domain-containing protein [Bacteroidales bacterium]
MKIKFPTKLKVFLKLTLTLAALWYVFAKIDLQQVLGTMAHSNFLYLAGALLLFVLSKMISSFRLNKYLGSIGIHISGRSNMKLYLLGMYYNLFLPGGIGGDGYKIYLLNRSYDTAAGKIFWAVMMDRIIGVLALFCMAVLLFCFIPGMSVYAWYIWILIPLSLMVVYLIYRKFFPYLLPVFGPANLLSLAVQLLQALSALLILLSLHVSDKPESYLFVFLISSMVAVLPLTIGGIGSREFTFMLGAQWLGLDLSLSIALSLLFYLITAFTSLWGIIYSMGPGIKLEGQGLNIRP